MTANDQSVSSRSQKDSPPDANDTDVRHDSIATLTAVEAAAQMSLSLGQFRRAVERGELPPPAISCRPLRWSVAQIEKWLVREPREPEPAAKRPATTDPPKQKPTNDPLMQVFADRLQALDDKD